MRRAGAGALLALGAALAAGPAMAQPCSPGTAWLTTPAKAPVRVEVELADDPAERAQGLMGRAALAQGTGMLFVYETPRPASFWMKNTLIPLDMLFFDDRGVLRHVHENAVPGDLTPIGGAAPGDSDPDRLLILELGGGEARRLGLGRGTTLTHPAVPQATSAAPCD